MTLFKNLKTQVMDCVSLVKVVVVFAMNILVDGDIRMTL